MGSSKEINLSMFWEVFKKFLVYVLIATLFFAILGGLHAGFVQKTTYSAEIEFYVPNFSPGDHFVNDSLLSASATLAKVCTALARKNVAIECFSDAVKAEEYFNVSKSQAVKILTGMISASDTDNGFFSVRVTSVDKVFVEKLIKAIEDEFPGVAEKYASMGETDDIYKTKLKCVNNFGGEEDIMTNSPSVAKSIVVLGLVGFILAYAVCFIIALFDTKLHDTQNIKDRFKEPILATIPEWYTSEERRAIYGKRTRILKTDVSKSLRRYNDKLINPQTPFAVTESFNALRTNLCYATAETKCPVFAVTSDYSASGKSLVSANVGIVFASLGKKVLLVECDMRCPDLNKVFGTDVKKGLSEILSGNIKDIKEGITKSKYENFDIVYSGHIPPNPSELLGSNKMKEVINAWKDMYDYIFLDMPPEIEVSDAGIVSSIVNGYLIVARTNHSDLNAISDVITRLNSVNGHIVGYVVNGCDMKSFRTKRLYDKYSKYSSQQSQSKNTK